jgi:hypothetical protein
MGGIQMIKFENDRATVMTEIISKSEKSIIRKITVHDQELNVNWECIQPISMKVDGTFKHMPIRDFAVINSPLPNGTRAKTPKSYYETVDSWESFREAVWYPYFKEVDPKLFS